MGTNSRALCLDLGGTALKMAVVEEGKILRQGKVKTDVSRGLDGIKDTYKSAVDFLGEEKVFFVAVSSAGRIDSQTGVCTYATQTLPGYSGFRIGEFLSALFHLPCYVINDGHAAGLGEYFARNLTTESMLMLTLGTGLGGVIISGGKIENFPADRDMGHLSFIEGGLLCTCGRRGCMECYVGGSALNAALTKAEPTEALRRRRWQRYLDGERCVVDGVESWLEKLKQVMLKIHALHGFDVAVLGGGVADDGKFWFRSEDFGDMPFAVQVAMLGNNAGLLGAYRFALSERAK